MNSKILERFLNQTHCHRCGESLRGGAVTLLLDAPIVGVVYVACARCGGEVLATLSAGGCTITNVKTELAAEEVRKFFGATAISQDDILDLHELVRSEKLWQALKQTKGKTLEEKPKASGKGALFRPSFMDKENPLSPLS